MKSLFALALLPEHVLIALMAVALAFFVTKAIVGWCFVVDDDIIKARKLFGGLATLLAKYHMDDASAICQALSQGDLVDAVGDGEILFHKLSDPKQAAALLDQVFFATLPDELGSATNQGAVLKAVGAWALANPDAVKAAGLAIAALPK